MLEILDPKNIDPIAYGLGILEKIREFSLLPDKRIGWNYCMDYVWLAIRLEGRIKRGMKIIDIGAGPGAIHGYLEDKYRVDIVGIDRDRWTKDYVDIEGDFTDSKLREQWRIQNNSYDLIISTSSFEHNDLLNHKRLVSVCLKVLKPGGKLVTTFSAAENERTYFEDSTQWNLSRLDLEEIYKTRFAEYEWREIWKRWHKHPEISAAYRKRYGFWNADSPTFLSAGADIEKNEFEKRHSRKIA